MKAIITTILLLIMPSICFAENNDDIAKKITEAVIRYESQKVCSVNERRAQKMTHLAIGNIGTENLAPPVENLNAVIPPVIKSTSIKCKPFGTCQITGTGEFSRPVIIKIKSVKTKSQNLATVIANIEYNGSDCISIQQYDLTLKENIWTVGKSKELRYICG